MKKRFNVLVLSLYSRRRAIPLVWLVMDNNGTSDQDDWQPLLLHLQTLLPTDAQVLVLGDQEFGSVALMRFLTRQGWDFCLRVKGNHEVYRPETGQPITWTPLDLFAPAPGEHAFLPNVVYTKSGMFRVHFALACQVGSDDPWYIATNLWPTRQTFKDYARRFGCEELLVLLFIAPLWQFQ